jgi:hypothetical protein
MQDYIRKKNKWLVKIHEWVQAHGGDPIIPFSGAYENEVCGVVWCGVVCCGVLWCGVRVCAGRLSACPDLTTAHCCGGTFFLQHNTLQLSWAGVQM